MTTDRELSEQAAAVLLRGDGVSAGHVRAMLREEARYEGSVRALARAWKLDASNLHKIMRGKAAPSAAILARLGLRRKVVVAYYAEKRA